MTNLDLSNTTGRRVVRRSTLGVLALFSAFFLLLPSPANAQSCAVLNSIAMGFGDVGPGGGDAAGAVQIGCDQFTGSSVAIRFCVAVPSGVLAGVAPRRMTNYNGGELLYDLYSDSARTQILGPAGSAFPAYTTTLVMPANGNAAASMPIYGRVHAGQSSPSTFGFEDHISGTATLRYAYNLGSATPPSLAECQSGGGDGSAVRVFSIDVTSRVRQATYDLSVFASASPTTVPVGRGTTATVLVSNTGPDAASDVQTTVARPPGLSPTAVFVSQGTVDAATGVWTVGALPGGSAARLQVRMNVTAVGPLAMTATITGGLAADTNPSNNATAVTINGLPTADTALSATVDDASPTLGDVVTLTLQASNAGPSTATNLVATSVLPAGLTLQTATPSIGTIDTVTGAWSIGTLPPGALATLVATARVDVTGVLNPSSTITAQTEIDLNTDNNSTGVLLNAGSNADVGVELTASSDTVVLGEVITVRVTADNFGPGVAPDVVVQGTLPQAFRIDGVTVSAGSVISGRWVIGPMTPGAAAILEITATAIEPGPSTFSVRVSHSDPDPNPANDSASASVNTLGINTVGSDVGIVAFAGTPTPLVSDNTTIYIVATNEGPGTPNPVQVATSIDSRLLALDALPSSGTFDEATGVWSVGILGHGASATLALRRRVSNAGRLPVTAQLVDTGNADPNPANDAARAIVDVIDPQRTVADVEIEMSGPPSAPAGGTAIFVADVINNGSTYALGLWITMDVPQGATFASASPSFAGTCETPSPGGSGTVRCVWPGQSVVGRGRLRRVTLALNVGPLAQGARLVVPGATGSETMDPFGANNLSTAETVIYGGGAAVDLQLTKIVQTNGAAERSVAEGQRFRYRLIVTNHGPAPAGAARVRETLLPALIVTNVVPSQGSIDAAATAWDIGPLASGATATLDVEMQAMSPGRFELFSQLESSSPIDANATNDRSLVVVDVVPGSGGGRFVATGDLDGNGRAEIITGSGRFEPAQVRVFTGAGEPVATFYPYDPRFVGGVRVAACDIDGDGRDELVTGAGPGGGPHVRVFKVKAGPRVEEVDSFYTDLSTYAGGVYVACADVTGDGVREIIAGSGLSEEPAVWIWEAGVFSIRALATYRLPLGPPTEIRVGTCDVNGDGRAEIIAGGGPGRPPFVAAFDPVEQRLLTAIVPMGGSTRGVHVSCGELTASVPGPEIAVTSDAGDPPRIEFYSAAGEYLAAYVADDPASVGGVRVAIGDVDASGPLSELVVASGVGRIPIIRVAATHTNVLALLKELVAPNLP